MVKLIGTLCSLFVSSMIYASDTIVLMDLSASMFRNEKAVKKLVKDYLKQNIPLIGFNDTAFEIKKEHEVVMGSNTNLTSALKYTNHYKNINYLLIATDGIPNNEDTVRKEISNLKQQGVKICSIYLSKNNSQPPQVIQDISDKVFTSNSLYSAHNMCKKIQKKWVAEMAKKINNDETKFHLF